MFHLLFSDGGCFQDGRNGPGLAPADGVVHGTQGVEMADGADIVGDKGKLVLVDQVLEAIGQKVPHGIGLGTGIGLFQLAEGVVTSRTAQRVGSQGAARQGLLAPAIQACSQIFHDMPLTAHATSTGIAAGDDLAKDGQVRGDVKVALGPVHTHAKTGDHFIKYQQGPVLAAEELHPLVEILVQGSGTAFRPDRLDKDSGCPAPEPVEPEDCLQVIEIIGEKFPGLGEGESGNAG